MNPILEGIVANLVSSLIGELAGSARRKLSGDPVREALKAAVSEALEEALQESGLSPADCETYGDSLSTLFRQDDVLIELSRLLDPLPDVTLDLDRLARELEAAGLDLRGLPGFDLKGFLGHFALAFYSAAGRQDVLRDLLDLKLVGRMVNHLGSIARSSDRTADGVERLAASVEGLRRELPGFVAGSVSEASFQGMVLALTAAGLIPAFDAFRLIEKTVNETGYDLDIDSEGRVRIAGHPPEGRALPPARLNALENVAVTLRRAVLDQQPNEADLEALAERYRQHVIRWFQHLTFQGMTPSARAIVLPLDEVYVELRAVAEVPEAADSFSVEERRLLLETERDPQTRDELMRQLDSLRRERWSRSLPERKSIAAALYHKDQRAFVILGDPGSGKTTLLHFLALVHARGAEEAAKRLEIDTFEADRLPIFVSLAAFDDMLRETPGLTLLEFLPRFYDRRRGLPGLSLLFRRALETGRALVLLDGLDEVRDSGTRNYVASQTGALIGEWSPCGVRFAVSSRFVGYREAPVPGSLPTLSVLDFGEKEIEVFVHRWARAYETWAAKEDSPEALRKARELERDLLEDVRSNDSVRRLAANPLMLTLLALLRRQVGRLPHRRVQLYEAYVSTMLDNWLEARSQGAREKAAVTLDRHQAENILIPMALWLQREKPSGTAGLAEIESKLTDICLGEKGLTREITTVPQLRGAEEHARRFLREMREMTGLLVARGHDAFGFLHLTFQEYFAGRALALLNADERWQVLRPHLHDPRWREPILLCAGRLGVVENRRKDVTDFVRRILSSSDETENDIHRNLLLTLAIACDDVNLDPSLNSELIEAAVGCLPTGVYSFAELLLGFLARLVVDEATGASLERCFTTVWESGDWRLQVVAVRILGRFAGRANIKSFLIERLGDEQYEVRAAAVASLSTSVIDPVVRDALAERLTDPSSQVRDTAVRSVAGLLSNDAKIREAVIERLGDPYVARSAAAVLSSIVRENREVRDGILAQAKSSNPYAYLPAWRALSDLFVEDAGVRAGILALLDDRSDYVRFEGLRMLQGALDDRQARALVIEKIGDPKLRTLAFSLLSDFFGLYEEVDSIVLEALRDEDAIIRAIAVRTVGPLVGKQDSIRSAVLAALEHPSVEVRSVALAALAPQLSASDIKVRLDQQAKSVDWSIRQTLAQIWGEASASGLVESDIKLIEIRENSDTAVVDEQLISQVLAPLSKKHSGWNFLLSKLSSLSDKLRARALVVLSDFVPSDLGVRRMALDHLSDDNWLIRRASLVALSGAVESDKDIRNAVLDRLDDNNLAVQQAALKALSSAVESDENIRSVVLDRLNDNDSNIQQAALSALSGTVTSDERVRRAVLDQLRDENWEVQRAALLALSDATESKETRRIVLDHLGDTNPSIRLAALAMLASWVGSDGEARRAVLDQLHDKLSYVQAAAIEALSGIIETHKEALGVVQSRLNHDDSIVRAAAASALSGLLKVDSGLHSKFVKMLDDQSFEVRAVAVQGLLPLTEPGTDIWPLLQEWTASDSNLERWAAWNVQNVLASVLGPRLPEDRELTAWVLERLGNIRWSCRLGAMLCLLAWPGEPPPEIMDRIFKALDDQRGLESYPARLTAASFLVNRNEDQGASIDLCLEALDYGTHPWEYLSNAAEIRKQAALILGKLEPLVHNQRVYDRLLRVLNEDEDPYVRDGAYNALVRLAGVRDRQTAV